MTSPAPSGAIFDDEFSGPLDAGTWQALTPWRTTYPAGDVGYYDPANVSVSRGALHLQTTKSSGDHYYASGIVTSLSRAPFSYGYFEVRALMPRGKGVWPAIWLTNDSGFEIDISEVLGGEPSQTFMTLHEHGEVVYQQAFEGPDFSAGWHTFGVDWQRDHVVWYVDGVERARFEGAIPSDPLWVCLDTAVGGAWPGYPDASSRFPQSFDIDYVRVYATRPPAR